MAVDFASIFPGSQSIAGSGAPPAQPSPTSTAKAPAATPSPAAASKVDFGSLFPGSKAYTASPAPNIIPAPQTNLAKDTLTGIPSAFLEVGNYVKNQALKIVAPGITDQEASDPQFLKNTIAAVPSSAQKIGSEIIKNPVGATKDFLAGTTLGMTDFLSNLMVNYIPGLVSEDQKKDTISAIHDTIAQKLFPGGVVGDIGAGGEVGGQAAIPILAGEAGGALAGKVGGTAAAASQAETGTLAQISKAGALGQKIGTIAGSAGGFISAGQTQLPANATIQDRAQNAVDSLVQYGLFSAGSYAAHIAKGAFVEGVKKAFSVAPTQDQIDAHNTTEAANRLAAGQTPEQIKHALSAAVPSDHANTIIANAQKMLPAPAEHVILPAPAEHVMLPAPAPKVAAPKLSHAEYAKSQGYEPYTPNDQLPVIKAGPQPKETLPTIQVGEKPSSTGSYKYIPIKESPLERTPADYQDQFSKNHEQFTQEHDPLQAKVDALQQKLNKAPARSQVKKDLKIQLSDAKAQLTTSEQTYRGAAEQDARGFNSEVENHLQSVGVPKEEAPALRAKIADHVTNPELVGQHALTSIKDITERVAKENGYEKTAAPEPEPLKVEPGTSHVGKSIEAKAIQQKLTEGFPETAKYDVKTFKDAAEKTADLINSGIDKARAVVRGEAERPEGVTSGSLIAGMEEYAHAHPQEAPDILAELANSPVAAETSEHAQELGSLRMREPDSATAKLRELKKAMEESAGGKQKTAKTKTAIAKGAKEAMERVNISEKEEASWERFLDKIAC